MGREACQNSAVGSRFRGTSLAAWTLSITAGSEMAWSDTPGSEPPAITETNSISGTILAKPFIKVLLYECVILKMRIGTAYPIEFGALTGREFFMRIETPAPFEQPLTPQYLMNTRNASVKTVCRIEDCAIRVRDLLSQRQQRAGNGIGILFGQGKVRDGSLRPHRPMPQQTADDSDRLSAEVKLRDQVVQNVVVVSRVQSDFVRAA